MSTSRATTQLDLFSAMEKVVTLAEGTQLSKEFFRKSKKYSDFIKDKLNLTTEQSVMLALIVDNSLDSRISFFDLARSLRCRMITMLKYAKDIEELERREFIYRSKSFTNNRTYHVPEEVIDAFKRNECYMPKSFTGLNCEELFEEFTTLTNRLNDECLSPQIYQQKIEFLLEMNPQIGFVKRIKAHKLETVDITILVYMCCQFVNMQDDAIEYGELKRLMSERQNWLKIKKQLYQGHHTLHKEKLISFAFDQGYANRNRLQIAYQAKQELLEELDLQTLNLDRKRPKIKAENIVAKDLFYDTNIQKQILELEELLDEKSYQEICSRLKATGHRCGFTCLFYGDPGTGKTETVMQLARKTGRDIMQIDVSSIRSMWVGESEKNIRGLFAQYRQKVKDSHIAPILFFNEADAIIGKRREFADKPIERLECTLIDLILEEMETLEGIMIATTNLEQNMDKAFERRFLYKVRFSRPSAETRKNIWATLMPGLNAEEHRTLAAKYEFSGGQIENIARRYTIDNILHGTSKDRLSTIIAYCEGEKIEKKGNKIGF